MTPLPLLALTMVFDDTTEMTLLGVIAAVILLGIAIAARLVLASRPWIRVATLLLAIVASFALGTVIAAAGGSASQSRQTNLLESYSWKLSELATAGDDARLRAAVLAFDETFRNDPAHPGSILLSSRAADRAIQSPPVPGADPQ